MKKLLFFIATIALLASCSNDSENSDLPDTKTHKVKFNVTGFTVDKEQLSKSSIEIPAGGPYCEYTIYKADGTVILAKVVGNIKEQALEIEEELPAGEYVIAVMYASQITQDRHPIYDPKNFGTDYCSGNSWIIKNKDNRGIYFNNYTFTVKENAEINDKIVLEPMWSQIDIKITDANGCKLPENANMVGYHITPEFYGFSIKDKISTAKYKSSQNITVPVYLCKETNTVLANQGLYDNVAAGADEEVTIRLVFIHHSETTTHYVIDRIVYKGKIERGFHYTFAGALGDLNGDSGNGNAKFNISVSSLVSKGEIPF